MPLNVTVVGMGIMETLRLMTRTLRSSSKSGACFPARDLIFLIKLGRCREGKAIKVGPTQRQAIGFI